MMKTLLPGSPTGFTSVERHVCPWWVGYFLASPLRRLRQEPFAILGPWVGEGMRVLEPGSGMGYFSIPLARLVGPSGRVICVDLQEKMLSGLQRRARRAGVSDSLEARACTAESLGVDDLAGTIDFALAFAIVHEVSDARAFFQQLHRALKRAGRILIAEPTHVSPDEFETTVKSALEAGFVAVASPSISRSHSLVIEKA